MLDCGHGKYGNTRSTTQTQPLPVNQDSTKRMTYQIMMETRLYNRLMYDEPNVHTSVSMLNTKIAYAFIKPHDTFNPYKVPTHQTYSRIITVLCLLKYVAGLGYKFI